jgi:hypothetical protein
VTQPQAPWFEGDGLEDHLVRARLDPDTEAFVRALARDGFAVADLGDEARALCDRAVADTEAYFAAGAVRVQDAWRRSKAVRRLATWPRMRTLLASAYGRDPIPFQTLNFHRGSEQALHADTIHFHSVPERFMCGVWIALEDVAPGSGPLVYHPGSHRLPVMTMREAGVNHARPGPQDYDRCFVPRFAERISASGLPETRAVLKKGWALVWAANLAHGGSAIETPGSTRRSLVVHNFFDDCVYYTPMTSDVEGGRLDVRLPPNVRSGGWLWPRRDGRRVWPRAKTLAAAVLRDLLRRPHVG